MDKYNRAMQRIANFREANLVLEQYWPKRLPPRLRTTERVARLLSFLGNPQEKLHVLHVAGTSGKTSTAYYAATLLHAIGYKVGLSVSPHVDEVNERVQIGMLPLDEHTFCQDLKLFLELMEESAVQLHYFELMIAFAFWEFGRHGLEYAVIEVGMGGTIDPTNVVERADKVCLITDIGLDHQRQLGTSLSEIAAHKAGIIHARNAVFCHRQDRSVLRVIQKAAKQQQADLHILDSNDVPGLDIDFLPFFQQRNFALAYAAVVYALRHDDSHLTSQAIKQAVEIRIPGRMEILQIHGKTLVMDAAHNPQELAMLAKSMRIRFGDLPTAALVSFAPGKVRAITGLQQLRPVIEHCTLTSFGGGEHAPFASISRTDLELACQTAHIPVFTYLPNAQEALEALLERPEPVLLITGSFFLLSEVRKLLTGTI